MEYQERITYMPPKQTMLERYRHWLRDGGFRYLFDQFFTAGVCSILASGSLLLMAYGYFSLRPKPAKPTVPIPSVIDHRKDGTSKPCEWTQSDPTTLHCYRLHFDIQTKAKP